MEAARACAHEAVAGRPVARPLPRGVPRRPARSGWLYHGGRYDRAGGSFLLPSPSLSRSAHIWVIWLCSALNMTTINMRFGRLSAIPILRSSPACLVAVVGAKGKVLRDTRATRAASTASTKYDEY